jgi:N-acetylmuramoyl-L-alanine amidase
MIQRLRHYVETLYAVLDPRTDEIRPVYCPGATVQEIAQAEDADAAINFNYADTTAGQPIGRLIVDGKVVVPDIPKTAARDELYMMPDGTLHIGKAPPAAIWAVQGSPPLLRGGQNVVHEGISRDQTGSDIWQRRAIRTAAGITADGKPVLVRTLGEVYLSELAEIMQRLGCVDALNGDGGGSSYMWPADTGWGRKLGSALIVKKGAKEDVEKPLLIIDAGHGGNDPGAIGNGIVEKEYTLKISLYQYERFRQLGIPVALTRDKDVTLDPAPRANLVKNSGAKYCISNHINASGGEGVETIHSIHAKPDMAKAIADAIVAAGQKFRRVFSRKNDKGQDYYYMHRLTGSVQTVIVEYGFCDNPADAERIKNNWEAYAEAAIKGFCQFAGLPYTPLDTAPAPTPEPVNEPVPVPAPTPADGLPKITGAARVIVNDVEIGAGYIIDGRTYVPLRAIGEALGLQVGWDQATKTATLKGGA